MSESAWVTGTIRRWKKDARIFVRECLGVTPDKWQDRALLLVSDPKTRRLAFKACKGPGKTAVLAWIILWFLSCHYESKVGCTSITEGNIDTNLWPELLKWINRSSFLKAAFAWSKTQVTRRGNENWFAVKRTWPKSGDSQQQADALAGIHADDVMFVLDESGGIPQAVMVTAEAVLATFTEAMEALGHRAIVVQSGNPTHTSGPLHRACTTDLMLWHVITITGDPDSPERSPRIDRKWAQEQIAQYGRDNPWVMVNVLGQFPPSSIDSLLGVEDVLRAQRRRLDPETYQWAQKRFGVDVARFGDDRSVVFMRQGRMSWRPLILRNENTTVIAGRVARNAMKLAPEMIFVDDSGHWGHGVVDQLSTARFPVIPVIGEDKANNPRYKNLRAECWMEMAEWVKKVGVLPADPSVGDLVRELTEITYTFIGGVFVLEPKDQMKKRLGYSPDLADALAYTFAMPDVPGEMMQKLAGRNHAKTDFDPYAEIGSSAVGQALTEFDPFE